MDIQKKRKWSKKKKKLKNTLKLPKFDKDHNLSNKSEQRKITLRHIIVKVLKNKEENILILASKNDRFYVGKARYKLPPTSHEK